MTNLRTASSLVGLCDLTRYVLVQLHAVRAHHVSWSKMQLSASQSTRGSGGFVYCIESLPRLRSVQLTFHTNCHKLSLSEQSLIAKGGSCQNEVDVQFGFCTLDLASHSHINITNRILSLKLRTLVPHPIPPPGDILGECVSKPATVSLVCSFCEATLTSKERWVGCCGLNHYFAVKYIPASYMSLVDQLFVLVVI